MATNANQDAQNQSQSTNIKEFKYDVAISLCSRDVEFARKILKSLNPGLKVFFYETNQHELITQIGAEKFGKVFKEESRVVIILSRSEWSESYNTAVERSAIIDRTSVKNEGYDFIFMIPMEDGHIPAWYPSTTIYADPKNFSISDIAKFIEFKVADEGGKIKQLTTEELYQNLLNKIQNKKDLLKLQHSQEALEKGNDEIKTIKDIFNSKVSILQKDMFDLFGSLEFTEYSKKADCRIGKYLLESRIGDESEPHRRIVRAQDYRISFKLYQSVNNRYTQIDEGLFYFYYSPHLIGWAKPIKYETPDQHTIPVLYRNYNHEFYDLKDPINSGMLIDNWFQKLLKSASAEIEKHL